MTTNALRPTHANRTTFPLMVTHLTGTQRQMGAQHGAITRAAGGWEPALEYYPQMAQLMIGGSSKILRRVLTPIVEASLLRLDRARPYELKARTEAFMEALGVDTKIARTLMVMDVLQNLVNTAGRMKLGPFARQLREQAIPACSTLVTWGEASDNGTIRHGRNFDFPGVGVWETAPEVVWCTPSDGLRYAFVTLRGGDVPGVTVFNEAGLVITTHTRFNERIDGSGMGIVDLVHNLVRKARTLDEAETLLRRRPIASSWGLCVTSALDGYSVCFEVSGELIRRLEPGDRESFMAATNRYVHPDLKTQEVTITP
ncbi:MAG: C45 family autoproteolytic acyltransferase/hydrolase, partial [Myxococcota bacterium]